MDILLWKMVPFIPVWFYNHFSIYYMAEEKANGFVQTLCVNDLWAESILFSALI